MTRSEDRSGTFSQGASDLAANSNHRLPLAHPIGDLNDGPQAEIAAGDPLPPLGAKLTCYRLLNLTTIILWAVPKAVLSYKNRSVAGTTVDLLGALCGVALYWVGMFEGRRGRNWDLFFKADLAPAFGHSAKRFIGGVVSALSVLCNVLVILPLIFVFLLSVVFFHLSGQGELESIEAVGGFIFLSVLLVFYF